MLRSPGVNGGELLMAFGRRNGFVLMVLSLHLISFAGCVTRTERIYPHERIPQDESVWDEVRREFGGSDSQEVINKFSAEPFYKRAARGAKETVSRWFQEDSTRLSEQEIAADRHRFERKRTQALEQLRDQQEDTEGEEE